jgi:hypothetical protein
MLLFWIHQGKDAENVSKLRIGQAIKLTGRMLFAIFGTIILDRESPLSLFVAFRAHQTVMCSFGPLFPIAQYTLAVSRSFPSNLTVLTFQKTLLTPAACYIAIALASSVLIFPQSLNHIVLTSITERPVAQCLQLFKLQDRVLKTCEPEDWNALAKEAKESRIEFLKAIHEIEGQVKLLQLEITRGRTSAADLARVFGKLKELGTRVYNLTSFVVSLDPGMIRDTDDRCSWTNNQRVQSGSKARERVHTG